jgi:sugar/nucleoside kinase (ribokinase family)
VPVFLNPAPFVEAAPQLVRSADVLIPNQVEAEALTGLPIRTPEDALRAAERLRGMGPSCVIVTLGEQGAVLSGPGLTGLSLALATMASAQGPTDLFLGTKRLPTGGGISAAA